MHLKLGTNGEARVLKFVRATRFAVMVNEKVCIFFVSFAERLPTKFLNPDFWNQIGFTGQNWGNFETVV